MVQVLQNNRQKQPSFLQSLVGGIADGAQTAIPQYFQQQAQQRQLQQANDTYKRLTGQDMSGIPPQDQAKIYTEMLKGQNKQNLNPLQKTQMDLHKAKIEDLNSTNSFFDQVMSDDNTQPQLQNDQNFEMGQQDQQETREPGSGIETLPDNHLKKIAGFAGQPGKKGVAGTIAKNELEKREKQLKESPGYKRDEVLAQDQARADTAFYKDLNERRSKQILKKESLSRLENMGKKKVTGKLWEGVLDRMGLTQLNSDGYREYTAEQKNQFTDFKAIAGSQLSAREFFTLTSAYPNANFTPSANQAIVNNLKEVHDTLDQEYKIAEDLKKENGGKIPEFFQQKINDRLQEHVSKKMEKVRENIQKVMNAQYGIQDGFTLMFDSDGEPLNVPNEDVAKLLDEGLADLP
jgi:hypothetical protein